MSKNYKGGYKLIDLHKVDMLALEVGAVISGIHNSIEASYGKPLLLTGIVIDGVEKNDVYIDELKVVDGSFVFKAYGYEITVDDEDNVEAVEIYVPISKSITTAENTKDISINDGDVILFTTTNDGGCNVNLPNDCYLLVSGELYSENTISSIYSHYQGDTSIYVEKDCEVYITRIRNLILVTASFVAEI